MKILVTGSSGLIGSALLPFLASRGLEVIRLLRSEPAPGSREIRWDPKAGRLDPALLEGMGAVIHLAGENIAGRWTAAKKARIRDSRVLATRLLSDSLARLAAPPKVLLSASAIGYYGDRGGEILDESSGPGEGFLPEICREWEEATGSAAGRGIRVVHLRFGVVLSPAGGALGRMLPPFRLGVGGRLGSGNQYMSWISRDDAVGSIHHAMVTDSLRERVNVVAPHPVTNREFTTILGRILRRPTVFPLPAFVARLAFGEMADGILLSSTRVEPANLLKTGYRFHHPDLEGALRHLLGE